VGLEVLAQALLATDGGIIGMVGRGQEGNFPVGEAIATSGQRCHGRPQRSSSRPRPAFVTRM
jgi:hypothetical protein